MNHGKALPQVVDKTAEDIEAARLAGYLNHKHDLAPGPITIWIELQRLKDFLIAQQTLAEDVDTPTKLPPPSKVTPEITPKFFPCPT